MTRQQSNQFVSRPILVAGFGRLLPRLPVGRLEPFGLALRFGAVTALLWEFADYLTVVRTNEDELRTAYTDTLGDLALGLAGSIVAALVISALGRATPGASRAVAR